ncbi:hypothetical protein P280DRAFT_280838 [Massarina eburnea CBS 473.64]|uniref:Rrn9 domain-containing protein n=1 Tax=Massarina eburnea CBS 473.64 TaxID=1395130 RepID=A0A6A6S2S6_9PLEO|nr:hypothetical protein P280DRAFT_280838 [Massarina eburnea CBS 473.64]
MSLFGGDGARSPLSPSREDAVAESQNAQHDPNALAISLSLDSDEDEHLVDAESDGNESEIEPSRPNKFTKSLRIWQRYTEADRQIAESLEDIESADLAAHLYNTHNLKKRVRWPPNELARIKNWQGKDSWLRKGDNLLYTDPYGDIETDLVPHKQWSAWPLPPNEIPKEEDDQQADSEKDTWVISAAGTQDAGEAIREEVLALLLRQARGQWLAREYDQGVAASDEGEEHAQSSSRTKPEEKNAERRGRATSHQGGPFSKATFLADDDEARHILQPSVNSLLTRLDSLALAIRRGRFNHFGRRADGEQSESEFVSDVDSVGSGARSTRAGPLKPKPKSKKSKEKSRQPKPKPTPTGDSDSASDYGAYHEDEDTNESSSSSESSPEPLARPRRGSSASNPFEEAKQAGLMDWSEVLGIASMTGWNGQAVARTAQRCAALFGESMTFRTFDESCATEPASEPIQFTPSTVPDSEPLTARSSARTRRTLHPFFDQGTLRCPHKDCWASKSDFQIPYRTIEHVMRVHKYDPRMNNAENEERMLGGVHIDGFLQPITAKQGWLGVGRNRSKSIDKSDKGKKKRKVRGRKQKVENGFDSPIAIDDSKV